MMASAANTTITSFSDVMDPAASPEVAMTSLSWCARTRQIALLNAVLSTHFTHENLDHNTVDGCHYNDRLSSRSSINNYLEHQNSKRLSTCV